MRKANAALGIRVPHARGAGAEPLRWVSQARTPAGASKPDKMAKAESRAMRGLSAFSEKSRRRPTLPHGYPCSTIGSEELNFRVRDGIGCGLFEITTGNCGSAAVAQSASCFDQRAGLNLLPRRLLLAIHPQIRLISRILHMTTLPSMQRSSQCFSPEGDWLVARHTRRHSMVALEIWPSLTTY